IKFEQVFVRNCLPGMDDALPMNPRLKTQLKGEYSGILNWFLKGYGAWKEQGLNTPEIIEMETRQTRDDSDKYASFFTECCLPMHRCKTEDLYKVYVHWAKTNENVQERYIPTRDRFVSDIKNRGYIKKSDGTSQCFYDICIKPSVVVQLEMSW